MSAKPKFKHGDRVEILQNGTSTSKNVGIISVVVQSNLHEPNYGVRIPDHGLRMPVAESQLGAA